MHEAIPEPASDPTNVIETGWLYQPFESAGRSTEAEVTVGGVESILNCSESCSRRAAVRRAAVENVAARAERLHGGTVESSRFDDV